MVYYRILDIECNLYGNHANMIAINCMDGFSSNIDKNGCIGSSGIEFECLCID